MKEFWLAILKNVITYVLMIIIVVGGGICIATQKFPPEWAKVVSAVNTIKDGYVSMINLRKTMGSMPVALPAGQPGPAMQEAIEQLAQSKVNSGATKDKTQIEMETTIALLQSMSQQINPQHQQSQETTVDPDFKKNILALAHQNQQLLEKMDKIQIYLEKMHVYLTQSAPRQPAHYSAVQETPPSRQPTSAVTVIPQTVPATNQHPNAIQAQQNVKK